MSVRPPSKLSGNHPLVQWCNRLLEYAISTELKTVLGGRIERGSGGTHLAIDQTSDTKPGRHKTNYAKPAIDGFVNQIAVISFPTAAGVVEEIYIAGGFAYYGTEFHRPGFLRADANLFLNAQVWWITTATAQDMIDSGVPNFPLVTSVVPFLHGANTASPYDSTDSIMITGNFKYVNDGFDRINATSGQYLDRNMGLYAVLLSHDHQPKFFSDSTGLDGSSFDPDDSFVDVSNPTFNTPYRNNVLEWREYVGGTGYVSRLLFYGSFGTYKGTDARGACIVDSSGGLDTSVFVPPNGANGGVSPVLDVKRRATDGGFYIYMNGLNWKGTTASGVLILVDSTGTFNATFDGNVGNCTGGTGAIRSMAAQSDGKLIIGGDFTTWNGASSPGLLRLNANGTRDTAFDTAMGAGPAGVSPNHVLGPQAILIEAGGKIVIGGQLDTFDGHACPKICRLNSSGSFDASFTSGIGVAVGNWVNCIAQKSNGEYIVAGVFSTVNGKERQNIAQLRADGFCLGPA